MESITFEDVLIHYQTRLKETSDEIETIKSEIKKAESYIDSGWQGDAADVCRLKLETVNGELSKALSDISEALVKLSAINEELASE